MDSNSKKRRFVDGLLIGSMIGSARAPALRLDSSCPKTSSTGQHSIRIFAKASEQGWNHGSPHDIFMLVNNKAHAMPCGRSLPLPTPLHSAVCQA